MTDKSHKELLKIIDSVRDRVKESDVYKDMCKKHGVDLDYIYLIPMAFDDIQVSARTNKGCIYFNYALLEDGDFEKEDHYMIHEIVHHFQQCYGDGPTQGSNKNNYLDNEFEQEGFQAQTEYLSETRDDDAAERYVKKVLDHHDVPEDERKKRREDLLNIAVEIYSKKKEAGLFRIPKAWLDRLSKEVLGAYSAQIWRKALELIDEGAGTKHPDGSVEVLGNDALLDLYYKGDSQYHAFLQNLSANKDEWKAKMIELPPGNITDEMMEKIRGLSYTGGDSRGRWERNVSKKEQGEFLLKLLSESSLSESQIESIKNDLERSPSVYPENIISNASSFNVEPVEFALFVLPDSLQFTLNVTREEDDLYEVSAMFPNDEMGKEVLESIDKKEFAIRESYLSMPSQITFKGNLEKAAEFATWLGHNVLMDSYVPYFANQMDNTYEMGKHGLLDLMFVIQECKQYTSAPAEKDIDYVELSLDLSNIIHDLSAVSEYVDSLDMKRYGKTFYHALVKMGWPRQIPIKVFIGGDVKYQQGGKERSSRGLWESDSGTISISFGLRPTELKLGEHWVRRFKDSIYQAQITMRHELQHMAQSMVRAIKNLDEEIGITSKKIRDPRESIWGAWKSEGPPEKEDQEVPHQLRDIEFHTRLVDAVSKFNRNAGNWPADLKREYAKKFVGEPDNLGELILNRMYPEEKRSTFSPWKKQSLIEMHAWKYQVDPWFEFLRKRDVARWQAAVREFMKATQ